MRSEYIPRRELEFLLSALMPENRLALEVSAHTGLRINDVLSLRTEKLAQRFTVREQKTGKFRRVFLSNELLERCRVNAGKYYVFEGRLDRSKHRTRQAIFKDLKCTARRFKLRLPEEYRGRNIAPHTARKIYAVEAYARTRDLKKVQRLLNHSDEAITLLYALADQMVARHKLPRK